MEEEDENRTQRKRTSLRDGDDLIIKEQTKKAQGKRASLRDGDDLIIKEPEEFEMRNDALMLFIEGEGMKKKEKNDQSLIVGEKESQRSRSAEDAKERG